MTNKSTDEFWGSSDDTSYSPEFTLVIQRAALANWFTTHIEVRPDGRLHVINAFLHYLHQVESPLHWLLKYHDFQQQMDHHIANAIPMDYPHDISKLHASKMHGLPGWFYLGLALKSPRLDLI